MVDTSVDWIMDMASRLKTALATIVIILIAVVGFSALSEYTTDLENGLRSEKRLWSSYKSQRTAADEGTDKWKSYINNKYGFSLKYPKDWFVQEHSPELIGFCPTRGGLTCQKRDGIFSANVLIEVYENPKQLKVREYLFVERYGQLPKNLAELTLDGYQAIRLGPEGTTEATVYVARNNYVYRLQSHGITDIFGKMMKTFKFIV